MQDVGLLVLIHLQEVWLFKLVPAHVLLGELDKGALYFDPLVVGPFELIFYSLHRVLEDAPRLAVLLHPLDIARVIVVCLWRLIKGTALLRSTFPEARKLSIQLLATSKVGEHQCLLQVEVHDVLVLNAQLPQHLVHLLGQLRLLLALQHFFVLGRILA